ncbi:MAG: transketolase family protein [Candidatus Bipolaricaulia bacterium]
MTIVKKTEKVSLRKTYGEVLLELGEQDESIVVLTADLAGSTYTKLFGDRYPERFFNMGVAEPNMMGVAAGLASTGKRVFVSTFGIFAICKALEPIRQHIAYPSLPVRIVVTHTGITVGKDGASHQTVEDISNMRALPNMTVVVPADAVETAQVIRTIAQYDQGPVYVRLSREAFPMVLDQGYEFQLGQAQVLKQGSDVTLFAIGLMVAQSLAAAQQLVEAGISAAVVNVSTVKPIDVDTVVASVAKTGAAVVAEEHSIIGGLRSAIAETLSQHHPVPVEPVGIPDVFGQSGDAWDLVEHYGLTPEGIAEAVRKVLKRKEG